MTDHNEITSIGDLIEGRNAAIRSKDADLTLSFYDPEVVLFDLAPPLATAGAQALNRADLQGWFDTWNGPIQYELRDFQFRTAGDLALAYGLVCLGGDKIGEGSVVVWVRQTVALTRGLRGWRIAHEHTSTPFYMDGSFKAAVDLRP